jgi:hypothetical protein
MTTSEIAYYKAGSDSVPKLKIEIEPPLFIVSTYNDLRGVGRKMGWLEIIFKTGSNY